MSVFCNEKINLIKPYVPGEQLNDKKYIKLNTNENPFYASESAVERVDKSLLMGLNRYSDPESSALTDAISNYYGVSKEDVLVTNGSDEALAFAFIAYGKKVCYADVTYGFYQVLANLFDCDAKIIELKNDFTINSSDYFNSDRTVVIANPNAQTGIQLSLEEIEKIIKYNSNNIVIIDQAYADFGTCNAIPLTKKYNNLLVVNTFSKSRSLAGARVGYVIANKEIITDLKKVKNSFHPYNVNTVSSVLAQAAILDDDYFKKSLNKVVCARQKLMSELEKIDFEVLPSSANFVLAKSNQIKGEDLYLKLKDRGVLVRYFSDKRISDFIRITIGTDEEMENLIDEIKTILKGVRIWEVQK